MAKPNEPKSACNSFSFSNYKRRNSCPFVTIEIRTELLRETIMAIVSASIGILLTETLDIQIYRIYWSHVNACLARFLKNINIGVTISCKWSCVKTADFHEIRWFSVVFSENLRFSHWLLERPLGVFPSTSGRFHTENCRFSWKLLDFTENQWFSWKPEDFTVKISGFHNEIYRFSWKLPIFSEIQQFSWKPTTWALWWSPSIGLSYITKTNILIN